MCVVNDKLPSSETVDLKHGCWYSAYLVMVNLMNSLRSLEKTTEDERFR
jgi:hypothetical protein